MFMGYAERPAVLCAPLALHLIEEINHRVLDQYAEAISILSMAASQGQVAAVPALTLAAERLRDQAEAHRALLAPYVDGPMDLGLYLESLCGSLSHALLAERGILLTVSADEIWLDSSRCWRVGLIVGELIRNAAPHGLVNGEGEIGLLVKDTDGGVRCIVSDNGNAAPNPQGGRGHRLIRALADDLGGSVEWWFTPSGNCVGLEFPREADALRFAGPAGQSCILEGSILS